jgi:hypothetical protein
VYVRVRVCVWGGGGSVRWVRRLRRASTRLPCSQLGGRSAKSVSAAPSVSMSSHGSVPSCALPPWRVCVVCVVCEFTWSTCVRVPLLCAGAPVLAWAARDVVYSQIGASVRSANLNVSLPESVATGNGTVFAHVCAGLPGAPLVPSSPAFDFRKAYCIIHALNRYMLEPKAVKVGLRREEATPPPTPPPTHTEGSIAL